MAEIVKLINSVEGGTLTRDVDFSLLAKSLLKQGVISGLSITQSGGAGTDITIGSGEAFVDVSRTVVTPNEDFLVVYRNTSNVTLTAGNNKKIYIQVESDNVNNPDLNTESSGINIGSIKIGDTLPSENSLLLAETDGTGLLILIDNKIKTRKVGGNLLEASNIVELSSNYTFTGNETNNTQFNVDTTTAETTLTIDLSLFPTTNGLYQFTVVKDSGDSNNVILDFTPGTIDFGNSIYELSSNEESVTFVVESDTKAKITSLTNNEQEVSVKNFKITGKQTYQPVTIRDIIYYGNIKIDQFDIPGAGSRGITIYQNNLIRSSADNQLIYIHNGITSTVTSSFASPGAGPAGVVVDEVTGNLISCDRITNQIYIHDGITSTVTSSFASPGVEPRGLTIHQGNLISCDAQTNQIYIHNGISSTITDNFTAEGNTVSGLTIYQNNLVSSDGGEYIYIYDGISSIVISNFSIGENGNRDADDIVTNGDNLVYVEEAFNYIAILTYESFYNNTIGSFIGFANNSGSLIDIICGGIIGGFTGLEIGRGYNPDPNNPNLIRLGFSTTGDFKAITDTQLILNNEQ